MSAEIVKPEILTAQEVAPLLGVSIERVYSLIRKKEIPSVKIGTRVVRIPRTAFNEYLRRLNAEALASVRTEKTSISRADVLSRGKAQSDDETADAAETAAEGKEAGVAGVLKALSDSPVLRSLLVDAEDAQKRHAEDVGHLAKYLERSLARH